MTSQVHSGEIAMLCYNSEKTVLGDNGKISDWWPLWAWFCHLGMQQFTIKKWYMDYFEWRFFCHSWENSAIILTQFWQKTIFKVTHALFYIYQIQMTQRDLMYMFNHMVDVSPCQTRHTFGSVIHHFIASWKPLHPSPSQVYQMICR